ncbi:MAG: hypothetical protein R2774_09215 [Saprospiraceae bacterium]
MKAWIFQIIFLFATCHVFTQSKDWKQINTPNKTAVDLLYLSSDGTLFGLMSITKEMAISTDNGLSWVIDTSFREVIYYYSDNNNFEENKNGKVFCFFNRNIFYFDKVKSKFLKFLDSSNKCNFLGSKKVFINFFQRKGVKLPSPEW